MLIRLSELATDYQGRASKIFREIYVQTESIEILHEERSNLTTEGCVGKEVFAELMKARSVKQGSFPTKIVFISGRIMLVAEMADYIVEKCNKPMYNVWPT